MPQVGIAQVNNPNFSSGNLSGWSSSAFGDITPSLFNATLPYGTTPAFATFLAAQTAGSAATASNGVVMSQASNFDGNGPTVTDTPLAPFSGTHMAFITNAASDTLLNGNGIVGAAISQSFVVPSNATTLSFFAMQLSNEGLDTVLDPGFNPAGADFAGVALHTGSTVHSQFTFDEESTSTADFHVTNFSPDGSVGFGGFVSGTGWQSLFFDLVPLRGQSVTLTAYQINTGDTNYESRLLFGGVNLATAGGGVAPEPGTLGLLAMGGILFVVQRKRKQNAKC